jgi:cell division protein FtsB
MATIIADSEAAAVQIAMLREYGDLSATNESLAKERDQLRAEIARLDAEKPWLKEANATNADLRAEVERLNDQLAKAVWDTDVNRANARADKAEAELAAERARLDWVEKHGPWDQWNGFRQTGITLHENIRASIDAAIKEGK